MKKKNKPKLKKLKEEEEVIKLGLDGEEGEEKVAKLVVGIDEFDEEEDGSDREVVDEIDSLLTEEKLMPESDVDFLFTEEKKTRHDPLERSVQRALHETKTSKASLLRGKSGHATHQTLEEVQVSREDVEEKGWGVEDEEVGKSKIKYVFIGLFVALLAGGVWGAIKLNEESKVPLHVQMQRAELADSNVKREEMKVIVAKIEKTFRAFNQAKGAAKLAYIQDSELLKDEVLQFYKQAKNPETYKIEKIDYIAEQFVSGKTVWMIAFYHREVELFYKRVFLEEDKNGDYKIDWRAISGYNNESWSDFITKQSKDAKVFRVRLVKANVPYYNWGFKDTTHEGYRISPENDDVTYWGYVDKKNKKLIKQLEKILKESKLAEETLGAKFDEVMLKVRFAKDSPVENINCMIIDELISTAWVDPREK